MTKSQSPELGRVAIVRKSQSPGLEEGVNVRKSQSPGLEKGDCENHPAFSRGDCDFLTFAPPSSHGDCDFLTIVFIFLCFFSDLFLISSYFWVVFFRFFQKTALALEAGTVTKPQSPELGRVVIVRSHSHQGWREG